MLLIWNVLIVKLLTCMFFTKHFTYSGNWKVKMHNFNSMVLVVLTASEKRHEPNVFDLGELEIKIIYMSPFIQKQTQILE